MPAAWDGKGLSAESGDSWGLCGFLVTPGPGSARDQRVPQHWGATMPGRNIAANLLYLKKNLGMSSLRELALAIGIDRSTLGKTIAEHTKPTDATLHKIARTFGLDVSDLSLEPSRFEKRLSEIDLHPGGVLIYSLGTTKNRHLLGKFTKLYAGHYELFNRSAVDNDKVIGSFLTVYPHGRAGLDVEIVHPSLKTDGTYEFVVYLGVIFPLPGCLYLFAERQSDKNEIVSMIFEVADLDNSNAVVPGRILGAAERDNQIKAETFRCAMRKVVGVDDWRKLVNLSVGVLALSAISKDLRKLL